VGVVPRLRDVVLSRGPLRIHQTLFVFLLYLPALALVTFFLPWHEVHGERHAGPDDVGYLPAVILAAVAAAAAIGLRRPRFVRGIVAAVAVVALCACYTAASFTLKHMFQRVRTLPGEDVWAYATLSLDVCAILAAVVEPLLYVWARRRART
jgi:glucan phosphoethanolaminetransferase (alkaline phosphatase superfamily)